MFIQAKKTIAHFIFSHIDKRYTHFISLHHLKGVGVYFVAATCHGDA